MTLATAQKSSAMATKKTVAGFTVYPITYGHVHWLREIRKNKILCGKAEDDFALAEICYALTKESLPLQSIKGASATKAVNDFLMSGTTAALSALFAYAAEQMEIHIKTLTAPKKQPAQANRKPVARVRKRSSATR